MDIVKRKKLMMYVTLCSMEDYPVVLQLYTSIQYRAIQVMSALRPILKAIPFTNG